MTCKNAFITEVAFFSILIITLHNHMTLKSIILIITALKPQKQIPKTCLPEKSGQHFTKNFQHFPKNLST